ncbi:ComEC/Rec2 family competence protein [Pedobacter fastidiosus]|uniref:ComEC/Rec2 family competence protein n=1 Tax=Pedobacter fastidiosus TaxID=2765361 RepID=A0ABR7KQL4_9SPHI|nr:ComEC/Rec2 family competence protein [Pedobacter fastidiosus]MBC6110376.1 ComEC/Rec2 family competence protein [Pedobacter fastidiosus]
MFKTEYIFARILLPMIIGIAAFYFFANQQSLFWLKIIISLIFISILAINFAYKKLNAHRFKGITGILIFVFFFMLGGLLCTLNNEKLRENYFTKRSYSYLKIWVNDEPEQTNDILRFKARVVSGYENSKQIKLSGQLLLALKLDSLNPVKLKYGDELIISAKYLEVEPPFNPAEFNFKNWLAGQNVYEQTFINQNHLLKTERNIGNPIIKYALDLREKQVAKYRKMIKDDEAFAVASTLILGFRADLSKETLAAYSKTGTIHALSVSGSHVAIIFLVLDFFLIFLNKKRILKIFKFFLICGLIWIYALITGLSPSVARSAIMITIFIASKTFARNKNSYNILAFAAFCQLIYDPFLIWDVGFELSYISVFGLIYLQPKIYKWIYIKNKWLDKIWQLIALSLSAQLVTFPLCIYYFHQFPVYFLLGNLFISIPLIIIMILGISILVPFIDLLSPIFEWIIVSTNMVLKWIADLPYSTFSAVWINLPELLLMCLALSIFVYSLAKFNKKLLYTSLLIFIAYQSMVLYDNIIASSQKKIIFFSLRKNYSAAFIKGRDAILLTDLDPQNKNYDFFVKPALDEFQIQNIKFINLKQDTALNTFIKKDRQIIFGNYKILWIDESLNYKNIKLSGGFSSLWLHNNTKFKLNTIPSEAHYKSFIIDATNKDYKIEEFKTFAENNKIGAHILKKNKAYLIDLSQ